MSRDGEYETAFDREVLHELGEVHHEAHLEDELAAELEGLHELGEYEGEQFFGKMFRGIARGVGGFIRRAAPILGRIAKIAAPIVGSVVGGPLGGTLAKLATSALGEGELEDELAHEFETHELSHEFETHELAHEFETHELSHELAHELGETHELAHEFETHEMAHEGHPESVLHELGGSHETHEMHEMHETGMHEMHHESAHEALAEVMAEVAAGAHHEAEAEAMVGAAVVTTLSAADRAALRRLLAHLVRGAAVLTRILRRRRLTRPAIRAVPAIVRSTVRTLRRQAAAGAPVSRRTAGRVMAAVTRRVLGSPRLCARAIVQNVTAARRSRPVRG
jgi:hypothetical protein